MHSGEIGSAVIGVLYGQGQSEQDYWGPEDEAILSCC